MDGLATQTIRASIKFIYCQALACKFYGIKKFNDSTAPNKNLNDIIKVFEHAGFKVNTEFVDSNNEQEKYHAIFIRKVQNDKQ